MLEKIRDILVEQLDLDPEEIVENASFRDDLGVDSLDLYDLLMTIEEEYGFEFPAEDMAELDTIGDVVSYLSDHGIEG